MLINPYNSVHHAFRQSVPSADAEQNGQSDQASNQTGVSAAPRPAVIASFSNKVPILNLENYSPTDANAEMLEALLASVRAAKAPKPEIPVAHYEHDTIAYGLMMAIKTHLGTTDDMWALGRADENGRTAIHEIGDMLTQAAHATKNMPNATAAERAMQREAVVQMASEIVDYYGFNAESADYFMSEVYRQVGMDSAVDSGAAIMRSDKYNSVQFVETPDTKWSDFLRDNVNDEVRKEIEQVLNKPIDLNNLDESTLESVLFVIGYNDYGLKQKMFEWSFMNDSLAENARTNFDSTIADEKYTAVNQWQSGMRDWIQQFSVSTKEQNETARSALNSKDWREEGITEESIFTIGDKPYQIDANGHLNIPEGENVIWGYNITYPPAYKGSPTFWE